MMPTRPAPLRRALRLAAPLALVAASVPAHADLAVRLSPGDAAGTVRFELANEGDAPVSVLRAGTPLEVPLAADAFDVARTVKGWRGVERAVYAGRVYKRPAPGPEDFVELAPGEVATVSVPIERHYAVGEAGDYRVSFEGAFSVADPVAATGAFRAGRRAATHRAVTHASAGVEVALRPGRTAPRVRPPAFDGCGANEQQVILEALTAAETIAGEALQALTQLPESERASSPRYTQWFGQYSPERYAIVANGYGRIHGALSGETIQPTCDCTEEGVFAYVRPSLPYVVHLCPAFWAADVLGTDSRAGTFVHELSHFTVLMGTDDHVYSQPGAADLARSNPDLAVNNADSVEYFAENTPALPIGGGGGSGPVPTPGNGPTPEPPANTGRYTALPVGTVLSGTLAEREQALYRTDGADQVSLSSDAGDADLYVFSDPSADETSLVCASEAFSEDSTLDVCPLPSNGTWYVVVRGYTESSYRILAEAVNVGGTSPGGPAPAPPATGTGPVGPVSGPVPADDPPQGLPGPVATGGSAGDGGGGALGWGALALLGAAALSRRARAGRRAR